MDNYLNVANHWMLWASTMPVVALVAIQAVIFVGRARKAAPIVGLTEAETNKAFRVGMTSAIGPALAVFVVMLGLMAAIGGPLAWQRLSVIGAAPTELTAATMAAQAQGLDLGGPGYGLINFANATWVMALNGGAWLLSTALLTDKLGMLNEKLSGGDPRKIALLGAGAMSGAFGYMFGNELRKILNPDPIVQASAIAAIVSGITMLVLDRIAKKVPALVEHTLGLSMLVGMAGAVIFKRMMGV